MADIIDEAGDREEELRQQALGLRKPVGPTPTGRCLDPACDEELAPGARWCDADCRCRYYRQLQVTLDKLGKYYDVET